MGTEGYSSGKTEHPSLIDSARWISWKGGAEFDDGCAVIQATQEPGEFGLAGIGTNERNFLPGLRGRNGVEVTLVRHVEEGRPADLSHPDSAGPDTAESPGWLATNDDRQSELRFITGMAVQIGSFYGQIGSEEDRSIHRGVQVHFDWIEDWGFDWWLVRTIMPDDQEHFPVWDMDQDTLQDYMKMGQHVTPPCFCLASTHYPPAEVESPFGHRLGLHLTDDGNTVYWTLDGMVRDRCDITGYFASCPHAVAEGAYLTISGVGVQPHAWTIEDVAVYARP